MLRRASPAHPSQTQGPATGLTFQLDRMEMAGRPAVTMPQLVAVMVPEAALPERQLLRAGRGGAGAGQRGAHAPLLAAECPHGGVPAAGLERITKQAGKCMLLLLHAASTAPHRNTLTARLITVPPSTGVA